MRHSASGSWYHAITWASCRLKPPSTGTWWRHQVETFPRYWPLCGEFTGNRWIPLTKTSDAELWFFYLRLNKRLSKQSWGWWFETPSRPSWHHCNVSYLLTSKDEQQICIRLHIKAVHWYVQGVAAGCPHSGTFSGSATKGRLHKEVEHSNQIALLDS